MAPLRGWAPRGRRLHAKVPHGRWKTMTFLAALRHDRIDAPWFIEGPIDGVSFRTYVEKALLPVLRPGDIVVFDLAPKFYPVLSSLWLVDLPEWAMVATGAGAEPLT